MFKWTSSMCKINPPFSMLSLLFSMLSITPAMRFWPEPDWSMASKDRLSRYKVQGDEQSQP
jgi:hypothetical protein